MEYWAAQDCMPHNGIPFIGRYSWFRPYWYVATGFHKWGMTASMISAMLINNMVCGVPSSYEEEESWDCPCHGSRYDRNKNVIDNPAQRLE